MPTAENGDSPRKKVEIENTLEQLRGLCPSDATACSAGWLPIDSAPKDGTEIIVYCPPAHGLPHMASICAYHEDAGFCVCELREPTLWIPLPNSDSATTG
jgi:hypothetical protein